MAEPHATLRWFARAALVTVLIEMRENQWLDAVSLPMAILIAATMAVAAFLVTPMRMDAAYSLLLYVQVLALPKWRWALYTVAFASATPVVDARRRTALIAVTAVAALGLLGQAQTTQDVGFGMLLLLFIDD